MEKAFKGGEMTVSGLAGEVARLAARVEELDQRLALIESAPGAFEQIRQPVPRSNIEESSRESERTPAEPVEVGLWGWLGKHAVLPRVAAACFMLVVALTLRTLTDSGAVGAGVGTMLGIAYVAVLIVVGWRFYAANRPLAPVFTGCGMLLMFSIIAESRTHFSILPAWAGSLLLVLTTGFTIHIAILHRSRPLLWFAIIGSMLVSLILDFPDTVFPAAAIILMLGLAGSMKAASIDLDRGLRWPVLLGIMFLFFLWGFKLNFAISRVAADPALFSPAPKLFAPWFMPAVVIFSFIFWGISARKLISGIPLGAFGHLLPLAGAMIMVMDGRVALVNWWQQPILMGIISIAFGSVLLALVMVKFRRGGEGGGNGFASMAVAAALLLFAAFPWLLGGVGMAQIFWPLIFIFFLIFSHRVKSGNIRFFAAFLAFVVMASGLMSGVFFAKAGPSAITWLVALSTAFCGIGAYFWCQRNPPPASGFFKHTDSRDYSSLSFLVSGLVGLFFASFMVLAALIEAMGINALSLDCGRTVLVNLGAAGLIVWGAIFSKDPGITMVGIVVALIGGVKVFFVDFFSAGGLSLVLSVTSFGALAALCSVVLGNWQKMYRSGSPAAG